MDNYTLRSLEREELERLGASKNNHHPLLTETAALTAKIHQRIDGHFSEFAEQVGQILFPQFIRPLPSLTIVQLTAQSLKRAVTIDSGTVALLPHSSGNIPFQTVCKAEILPLSISSIQQNGSTLVIHFQSLQPLSQIQANRIRFYIDDDVIIQWRIRHILQHHALSCRIVTETNEQKATIVPVVPGTDFHILPFHETKPASHELLENAFFYERTFGFFDIAHFGSSTIQTNFSVQITFRDPTHVKTILSSTLRLHCVPAVNLFHTAAKPIRISNTSTELELVPQSFAHHRCGVYSVGQVVFTNSDRSTRIVVPSLLEIISGTNPTSYIYTVNTRNMRSTIAFRCIQPPHDTSYIASVDMLAHHQSIAEKISMHPGELQSPHRVTVQAIATPTQFTHGIGSGTFFWQTLATANGFQSPLQWGNHILQLFKLFSSRSNGPFSAHVHLISHIDVKRISRLVVGHEVTGYQFSLQMQDSEHVNSDIVNTLHEILFEIACALSSNASIVEVSWSCTNKKHYLLSNIDRVKCKILPSS